MCLEILIFLMGEVGKGRIIDYSFGLVLCILIGSREVEFMFEDVGSFRRMYIKIVE